VNLIFTWDDLKRILKSKQRMIIRLSLLCGAISLLYFLTSPLEYEARATFKQSNSRGDQGVDIKNLLRSFSTSGPEGTATTLMLSDSVLGKTIEEIGLQVEIKRGLRIRSAFNNILAEIGISPLDQEMARFSSVTYSGEKPLILTIKKISDTEYALYSQKQELLTKGVIDKPIRVADLQWTLHYLPNQDQIAVTIHPLEPVIHSLRSKLTIKPTREDKNLLVIRCADTDRKRSCEIVNTLMSMYEKYLVEENKIIIGAQLSYLNQRQDELSAKLNQDIEDHAKALKYNLKTEGFLGVKDEMAFILEPLQTHQLRLDEVEVELRQIEERLALADREIKLSKNEPLLIERYSKVLADQISSARKLIDQDSNFQTRASLRESIDLLTSREKSLRENSEWIQTVQNELTGMSIESARKQFDGYSTQFDELHTQLKQVMFMRDHLFDPHFEISTLSNILSDSITQQMVQKSTDLEAQLHDDMHHSLRDRDRLTVTLNIHKRFLQAHLDQTLQLGKIRIDLIKEKLSSLYSVMKTLLTQEQEVLKGKISELKQSMQSLPDLWVNENRLKFKSELTKGMMEGLVGIAETKNLSHHLYQVESRPLDKAKPPLEFVKPRLIIKSTLAFFLGVLILSLFSIIYAFIKGFPLTLTTLKQLGAHVSGMLSQESQLETHRRAAAFLLEPHGKGTVAVIGESQTLFFPQLTALLNKYHKTCCVVDCSFGKIISADDQPGLFQVLNGSPATEMVRNFPTYDFLPVGASSPDSVEYLKSSEFKKLLVELSNRYDFIFLLSRTSLDSLESEAIFEACSHAIIVAETSLEILSPYLDPSRQIEKKYVTFVQYAN
jgi:uncharacterized protein involved in exopolysaccharide biosynthesis